MDSYFASIEQRDISVYKGKPLLVTHGWHPNRNLGIVMAASYEARPFGIKAGTPIFQAKKLCPKANYVKGNFEKYLHNTRKIVGISRNYSDLVEVYSIDELFLDITNSSHLFGSPVNLAKRFFDEIKDKLGLSCSIGIGPNKLVAKMAGEFNKPRGITYISADELPEAFAPLPAKDLLGVGYRMKKHLRALGIETVGQLQNLSPEYLKKRWGVMGVVLHNASLGIDNSPLIPSHQGPGPKSFGHSSALGAKGIKDLDVVKKVLLGLTEGVCRRMRSDNYLAKTITLRMGLAGLMYFSRARSLANATDITSKIYKTALDLMDGQEELARQHGVSLIAISAGNLKKASDGRQLDIFGNERLSDIDKAVDRVKNRYGEKAIIKASLLGFNKRYQGASKVEIAEVSKGHSSFCNRWV